jgi:hypothetical protein
MKEFILIVRVPLIYSPEDAKSVRVLWDALTDEWKAAGIFVSSFVFPSKGFVISKDGSTLVQETVVSKGLKIVSVIVLRAFNYEEVIEKAKQCPILKQKGMVEVVETMVRSPKS